MNKKILDQVVDNLHSHYGVPLVEMGAIRQRITELEEENALLRANLDYLDDSNDDITEYLDLLDNREPE